MNRNESIISNRLFLLCSSGTYFFTAYFLTMFITDSMVLQAVQELLIAIPCVFYVVSQRESIIRHIGLKAISVKQWVLVVLLAICIDIVSQFLNIFSQLFAKNEVGGYMAGLLERYPFVVTFLVVAVMPAICEELAYRGVIYQGYRKNSRFLAVLLTSLLFGLMHMNLNQFVYAFVLGILFALINEAAGSILPSMAIHLFINGKSTFLLYSVLNLFRSLRAQYVAAELAGNAEKMQEIQELAGDVPVQSADWLTTYLSQEVDPVSQLFTMLPAVTVASVGIFLLIRALVKISGREKKFRKLFEIKKVSFFSPTLFIGIAICVTMMVLAAIR